MPPQKLCMPPSHADLAPVVQLCTPQHVKLMIPDEADVCNNYYTADDTGCN